MVFFEERFIENLLCVDMYARSWTYRDECDDSCIQRSNSPVEKLLCYETPSWWFKFVKKQQWWQTIQLNMQGGLGESVMWNFRRHLPSGQEQTKWYRHKRCVQWQDRGSKVYTEMNQFHSWTFKRIPGNNEQRCWNSTWWSDGAIYALQGV